MREALVRPMISVVRLDLQRTPNERSSTRWALSLPSLGARARQGGFTLGSIAGRAAVGSHRCVGNVEVHEYPELGMEPVWRMAVENFPAFHRRRRQGERLLLRS